VETWLDAVDRADAGAATALCAPDVEVVGPRGRAVVASSFLVAGGAITATSGTTTACPPPSPPPA
jgi:hypothetical protein